MLSISFSITETFSFPVDDCLSEIHITGESVIESGTQEGVELSCSFQFISSEYKELDIKWYFDTEEEPFLQWVPSSGREPQTVGQMFKSRVTTRHTLTNTTHGYKTEQVIRVLRPSIHMSGHYHCKVATFTQEDTSTHSLVIYGKNTCHIIIFYIPPYSRPRCRPLPLLLLPP